jgi:hypothetical protein
MDERRDCDTIRATHQWRKAATPSSSFMMERGPRRSTAGLAGEEAVQITSRPQSSRGSQCERQASRADSTADTGLPCGGVSVAPSKDFRA